jgi:sugar lactone lactonase YvrE
MIIRQIAVAAFALGLVATPAAAAAPPQIKCPSTNCIQLATGLGEPVYTAEDSQGNLFMTYQDGQLRKVVPSTGQNVQIATGLGNLRGLALDNQGNAYVANFNGQLQKVNLASGAKSIVFTNSTALHAVAYSAGSAYVSTGGGELWQVIAGQSPRKLTAQIGYTDTVALDNKGNAYTGDMFGNRIQRTDLTTGATQTVTTTSYEMTSVSVGSDGRIYFALGSEVWQLDPATSQKRVIAQLPPSAFRWNLNADGSLLLPGGTTYRIKNLTQS